MPDTTGFERFYRENFTRIVRACALITLDRSLAEELAAEAFARTWSRWGVIQSEDHAGGFVFKTAMRLCAREARRRHRLVGMPPPSGDTLERALERQDVEQALSTLPVRQRQVVVLRDWAGFETAEVARLTGMRPSTVRVHLARAREHLRRALSIEEGEHEYRPARP
jgi:RNA polymerase sigma factor (sigma-70 family)